MPRRGRRVTAADRLLAEQATLLDVVDNALTKGVVLTGDLTLALADVDLIYARLSLLLCAADRVLPREAGARARSRGARGVSR
jgi:hypothetical protein